MALHRSVRVSGLIDHINACVGDLSVKGQRAIDPAATVYSSARNTSRMPLIMRDMHLPPPLQSGLWMVPIRCGCWGLLIRRKPITRARAVHLLCALFDTLEGICWLSKCATKYICAIHRLREPSEAF